jgi:hypothetical protein
VSTVTIYIPKDNGDLAYVADVEDEDRPDMALDAVLDELPRISQRSDTFIAIVDGLEDGKTVVLTLGGDEVLRRPKRSITMSNGAAEVEETVEEEEAQQVAPRRRQTTPKRGRPRGSTTKTAAKTPAKRGGGRKTPFTRNAKSDD